MRWSAARHDGEFRCERPALPRTSRPTSSIGRRVAAQSRLGVPSPAFAVCPYRIQEGEQYGLQRNRTSIQRGLSFERLAIQSRPANEFSRVERISLSYVGRRGSCVGCADPNVGMGQTPQLYWTPWIQGMQLDRRAPWDRSTLLRFCLAESRRHTDGLSRRANRYSSYPIVRHRTPQPARRQSLRCRQAEARTISQTSPTHADCRWRLLNFAAWDPPVGGRIHDDGTIGYEVLPEADHPNHFTVIEEWTTSKSRDAHLMAAHTRAFREGLPKEGALYDARLYNELN